MTLSSITGDVRESQARYLPTMLRAKSNCRSVSTFTHTFVPQRRFSPLHRYYFIVSVDGYSFPGSLGSLVQCERRER